MTPSPAVVSPGSAHQASLAGPTAVAVRTSSAVHIDVFTRFDDALPDWRRLADDHAVATPFSHPAWLETYHRHAGEPAGETPAIIVGRDDDAVPAFLLPFAVRRKNGLAMASFFGGSHASLNLGVWRRNSMAEFSAERLKDALVRAAALARIDLYTLRNMPLGWEGVDNPFVCLPHQRGADDVYRLDIGGRSGDETLKGCMSGATRSTLRSKEKKLAVLDGYRYFRASTTEEADRILDAFLVQKAARLAEQGIDNVFDEPGVADFLRATAHAGLAEGRPIMELHAIEGGGEVLAMLGGLSDGSRFTTMINSYTLGEYGRWSPGLLIINHVVRHFADQGLKTFDLGMGYAPYKQFFCKEIEPLVDVVVPVTATGHAAAIGQRAMVAAKRFIKTTPALWHLVQKVRRLRA
jgi:CelD/BcsL family acetyltransferase involved in cellulose biosynthesis